MLLLTAHTHRGNKGVQTCELNSITITLMKAMQQFFVPYFNNISTCYHQKRAEYYEPTPNKTLLI